MADKKRPRLSRLSPGSKLLAKERRKGTLREYQQSRHVVRLSDDTWNEWNRLKKELNVNTHDEFAVRLLQAWAVTGQIPEEKESEEERSGLISERTPIKSKTEGHVVHSTPANLEVAGPSFPVSDISESNGGSETEKSEDSVVTRYLEKARKTDESFLQISYDIIVEEKTQEESYQPDSEWSDEEDLSELDDTDDFVLDMTLQYVFFTPTMFQSHRTV